MGLFGDKKTKIPVSQFATLLADGLACNHPNRRDIFDKMFIGWGKLEHAAKFEWTVLDSYLMWHAMKTWFIERGNRFAPETLAFYIEKTLFAAMRENPALKDREASGQDGPGAG